jgi:hypothetical protein
MNLTVRRYENQYATAWDSLVTESWNGTFLHKRQFLSYHGERFQDLSFFIEDPRGRIVGVFPAALDVTSEDLAVSHPGLTYGGVVHKGSLQGSAMLEVLRTIAREYQALGLRYLRYKVVPYIYHKVPSTDDLHALFHLGAGRYRCDLSAAVDLGSPERRSKNQNRRRDLKKARQSGLQVTYGPSYFEPFWAILKENLATKHNARPVHTLAEITHLQSMFPEEIECVVGRVEDEIVAGIVLFRMPQVVHAQYIGSTTLGQEVGALTAVIDWAIEKSKKRGARYFDFGISDNPITRELNEGLHKFKTSFGAGGVVHEFYELGLKYGSS